MPDFTTDDSYHEHGINLVHGFLTEFYVEEAGRLVLIPAGLRDVGVLLEPYRNSDLAAGLGARYLSTQQTAAAGRTARST